MLIYKEYINKPPSTRIDSNTFINNELAVISTRDNVVQYTDVAALITEGKIVVCTEDRHYPFENLFDLSDNDKKVGLYRSSNNTCYLMSDDALLRFIFSHTDIPLYVSPSMPLRIYKQILKRIYDESVAQNSTCVPLQPCDESCYYIASIDQEKEITPICTYGCYRINEGQNLNDENQAEFDQIVNDSFFVCVSGDIYFPPPGTVKSSAYGYFLKQDKVIHLDRLFKFLSNKEQY